MIVFKNYFKIIKSYLPTVIMYTTIFMVFAILITTSNSNSLDFTASKPKIGIINNDSNSSLTKLFIEYVESQSKVIDIQNKNEDDLNDALFFRNVDYIMTIPQGFGNSIIDNNIINIDTMKLPDSYNATYAEMLFNRFINIAKTYSKAGIKEEKIINLIKLDLEKTSSITVLDKENGINTSMKYFYNFANYTILAICILIISMLISIFNDKNIKKRNLCSATSYLHINKMLFICNALLSFLIFLIYIITGFCLFGKEMLTINGLLITINVFIFTFSALSLGFMIGNLVSNKEAQNGIVNVIALGSSFICGAFVPQEYLSTFVLNLGKILPSYWYIKNNNDIVNISNFTFDNLSPIIINMAVILGFGILFFILTNLISKYKRNKN